MRPPPPLRTPTAPLNPPRRASGWYDPLLQNEAYVTFATDAPGYGPLQNASVLAQLHADFYDPGGCRDQEIACEALGNTNDANATANHICRTADDFCVRRPRARALAPLLSRSPRALLRAAVQVDNIFVPAVGDRDSDDLRQSADSPTPFPPEFYLDFLANATIKAAIGATSTYSECADAPFDLFDRTGDVSPPRASRDLSNYSLWVCAPGRALVAPRARRARQLAPQAPHLGARARSAPAPPLPLTPPSTSTRDRPPRPGTPISSTSRAPLRQQRPRSDPDPDPAAARARSCNWLGGHASVLAMDWYGNETLHATPFANITIDGTAVAAVQNVDNFSFACVSRHVSPVTYTP